MLHRKRTFHHLRSRFCTPFLHSIYPAGPPVFHPWFWSVTTRNFTPPQSRNFNIYNFSLQSAGCFRETKKHLRKTIRHLEKTTKHLEKTTKHLEKITKHLVLPAPGLFRAPASPKSRRKHSVAGTSSIWPTAKIQNLSPKSKCASSRFNISPVWLFGPHWPPLSSHLNAFFTFGVAATAEFSVSLPGVRQGRAAVPPLCVPACPQPMYHKRM